MNTKTTNYLTLFVMIITLFACSDDEESKETVFYEAGVSQTSIEVNTVVTFTDNSTGVTSRNWTFPGGSPASSTEATVEVSYTAEGPVDNILGLAFNDGQEFNKTFVVQVGTEAYRRNIFGFEDATAATTAWNVWADDGDGENEDSTHISFTVDETQGANGTSSCAKIELLTKDMEVQFFTKNEESLTNAFLDEGKEYVFSCYVKSADYTKIGAMAIENLNYWTTGEDNDWAGFGWWSPVEPEEGTDWTEWTQLSIPMNTNDQVDFFNAGKIASNVYTLFKFLPATTGTYYIDEISIVEGILE